MTVQKYSIEESLERILRVLTGKVPSNDTPNGLAGEVRSWNVSLSQLAELMQESLPGEVFTLPPGTTTTETLLDHRWVSGTFTVVNTDEVILCGIGGFTGTMCGVSGNAGLVIEIKNAGTGTVQVNGDGSETIDGSSISLAQNASATLFTDGTAWYII